MLSARLELGERRVPLEIRCRVQCDRAVSSGRRTTVKTGFYLQDNTGITNLNYRVSSVAVLSKGDK